MHQSRGFLFKHVQSIYNKHLPLENALTSRSFTRIRNGIFQLSHKLYFVPRENDYDVTQHTHKDTSLNPEILVFQHLYLGTLTDIQVAFQVRHTIMGYAESSLSFVTCDRRDYYAISEMDYP